MIGNHHPFDFLIFSLDKIWVSLITKKTTIYCTQLTHVIRWKTKWKLPLKNGSEPSESIWKYSILKPPWILCRHFSNHTTTAKGPDHHHPEWGALAYYRGPASEWLLCRHTRGGAMAKENPATFPKKRTWDSRGASDIGLSHGCGKHQRLFFLMAFSCGENGIDKNEQQSDHLHIIKRLKKVILRLSAQTNLSNLCLALDQLLLHSWLKPPKHLQNSPERYSFPRPPSHVARKSFWPFCVGRISQLGPPFFGWKENKKQSTICWEAIGLEVPCVSTYFSSLGQWTLN